MFLSDSEVTRRKPDWWSKDAHARVLDREADTACAGIQMLKRLTRLSPIQRQLLAAKKIEVIPKLFELKRKVDAERKAGDPRWVEHYKAYRANVEKGWGQGYALTNEADELARAACEFARAKVDAWEVLAPAVIAAKIARIPKTEKERLEQQVEQSLKTPKPTPPQGRSFSKLFWNKVDDRLDGVLRRTKLSAKWRSRIKKAAHAAIEKGGGTVLGKVLGQAGVKGETKEAIETVVRAAAKKDVGP